MIPFHWKGNSMFENKRIAVLGAGKMGEALITGMLDAGIVSKKQFIATAAHNERLEILRKKLGIETTLVQQGSRSKSASRVVVPEAAGRGRSDAPGCRRSDAEPRCHFRCGKRHLEIHGKYSRQARAGHSHHAQYAMLHQKGNDGDGSRQSMRLTEHM